jgi:hypothetical protein
MTKTNRKWALAVAAAALMAVSAVSAHAWTSTRVQYLTFSGAVALPGVTLPAGTYMFEVVSPQGAGDIVGVSSRDGKRYFLAFTRDVVRPHALKPSRNVTFAEAPAGTPPPITAWYPSGKQRGHEFVYHAR